MDVFRASEFDQRDASSRHVVIIYDLRPAFWVLNCYGKGEARKCASTEGALDIQRIGFVTLAFCLHLWSIFLDSLILEAVRRGSCIDGHRILRMI